MGAIYREHKILVLDEWNYEKEMNRDGTEKHIGAAGARYHVLSYRSSGVVCSELNCELNKGATK